MVVVVSTAAMVAYVEVVLELSEPRVFIEVVSLKVGDCVMVIMVVGVR